MKNLLMSFILNHDQTKHWLMSLSQWALV